MSARPLNVAVTAMGGQGGGVLAGWILQVLHQNFTRQQVSTVDPHRVGAANTMSARTTE